MMVPMSNDEVVSNPMAEPNPDNLDEALKKIEIVPPDAKDAPLGLFDKSQLKALIANQVREARLDELIGVRGWTEYEPDPKYSPAERFHIVPYTYLTNRIAELRSTQ